MLGRIFVVVALLAPAGILRVNDSGAPIGLPGRAALAESIRQNLSAQGNLAWTITMHDQAADRDIGTVAYSAEESDVRVEPDSCKITYHWKTTGKGQVRADTNVTLALANVASVEFLLMSEQIDRINARNRPGWHAVINPTVYVLEVKSGANSYSLNFATKDSAENAQHDILGLAKLCGSSFSSPRDLPGSSPF